MASQIGGACPIDAGKFRWQRVCLDSDVGGISRPLVLDPHRDRNLSAGLIGTAWHILTNRSHRSRLRQIHIGRRWTRCGDGIGGRRICTVPARGSSWLGARRNSGKRNVGACVGGAYCRVDRERHCFIHCNQGERDIETRRRTGNCRAYRSQAAGATPCRWCKLTRRNGVCDHNVLQIRGTRIAYFEGECHRIARVLHRCGRSHFVGDLHCWGNQRHGARRSQTCHHCYDRKHKALEEFIDIRHTSPRSFHGLVGMCTSQAINQSFAMCANLHINLQHTQNSYGSHESIRH